MESKPAANPKTKPTTLTQDLYPELSTFSISPRTAQAMRASGLNPTQELQKFEQAHKSKNYQAKAELAGRLAYFNDTVEGGNAAQSQLDSYRLPTQAEATPRYGSVSTGLAIGGTIYNGFLDMAEGAAKLPVIGAGLSRMIDGDQFNRATKGIQTTIDGMKAYVSQDWQRPAVSYDPTDGVQFDMGFKSIVGTLTSVGTFMLPGLLTGGAASIATMGERAALKAATTGAERAIITKTLGKAGQTATYLTGAEAFLQTMPMYQREAQKAGLDVYDSSLYGLIVGGINSVIETASMGPLTKALGISEKAAKSTIRQVGASEAVDALQKLTGPLTADMLLEAAHGAARNTLGVISRPEELKAAAKFFTGIGGKLKNGFLEQGLPEAGEEFFQSIVENSSKQIYNNLASADTTGRFKDPTWQQYAFDALYGATLGAVMGTVPGSFFGSKQADPTVFGYVGSNVRNGLQKSYSLADMVSVDPSNPARLKMLGVLDHKLETGEIDEPTHADLTQKVGRMAGIAADFASVDGFSEKDRHTMFSISEAQFQSDQSASAINQAKAAYQEVSQAVASPDLSMGEQIKAQIRQGELEKQLGGLVDTPNGPAFQAEVRQQQRTAAISEVKAQAMRQYADDTARPAINAYVSEHVDKINTDYGVTSYPDTFKPAKVVTDPNTGQVVVSDGSKLVFRNLTRTGGTIVQPAVVDENGVYTPAVREQQTDTYSEPLADLNTHIGLATDLADRNNPLEATDYTRPDNSIEASWIADGQQLVQDLQTLTASKAKGKKAALAETQQTALAYLNSSGFLLENPKYASAYSDVVNALQPSVGELFAQQEQNATPAGGEVDLLASENPEAILNPEAASGNLQAEPLINTDNVTNTPTPAPIVPARLATPAKQSPTVYDEYAAELQRADSEEQRQQSGTVLQQATESLAESAGTPVGADQSAISRLLDDLDSANNALEQELANYASPATEQPADESTAGARPKTLASIWQNELSLEQQQQSAQLAGDYLAIDSGQAFSDTERRIAENPPVIANLQDSFTRIAGLAFWQPIMQAKYGAKASNESALTLDQYAQEVGITEQEVVDFITSHPAGVDQLYSKARAGIREQFRTITGKEINKLSAQNVLAWASAQPNSSPDAVSEVTDVDLAGADSVLASLSPEEQAYVGTLIENYQAQYGDEWASQLHQDDRAGQLLVELPQSVSELLTNVVSSAIFENNQQQLADVRNYLQSNALPTTFEPVADGEQSGEAGPGLVDRQPSPADESARGQRPTATTLENATEAIGNQGETESVATSAGVVEAISAEAEQQIDEQLTPIAPAAAPFNETGQTTFFARSADVPNGFSVESLSATPSRTPLYEILPVSETEAEYRLVPTESARQLAMSDPYSYLDAVEGYGGLSEDDLFVTTQNGRLTRNGDTWVITQKAQVRNVSSENVPTFQLNQSENGSVQPQLKAFTDRIASAFGISIVTDPAQYQKALADSKSLERTGGREPIAFRYKGVVYLSPNANGSSLLHEAAGIWAEGIRKSDPALFAKGVSLVKQSKYYQQLLRDPYYRTLTQAELEIEALETAIGDKGMQFATEGRKSAFRQFLDELWGKIKNLLGIDAGVDLENMTLDDFVKESVGQILSGDTQIEASVPVDPEGVQFQLPYNHLQQLVAKLGVTPTTFTDLKQTAQLWLENTKANLAIKSPTGVDADLWNKAGKYNLLEQEYINEVARQTGFKLTAPGEFEYTRPNTLYHLANSQIVFIDKAQIAGVVDETFGKLYNDTTHRGRIYKFVTDYLKPWTNSTTFAELIDDKEGSLSGLIRDIQLESSRNANVVKNLLQDKRDTAEKLLAQFDESTIAVESYDYDASGNVQLAQKTIPLTTAMELVALGETQLSTYKKAAHIFDKAPRQNELYESTSTGLLRKEDHGAQYLDRENDRIDTIFLPRAEYDTLLDRFQNGNGAVTGESEAYTAMMDFFNQQAAADALENESATLNPDQDFIREKVYYPLRVAGGDSNARMERQGGLKLYDENGRLKNRRGTPKGIVVGNPVQTMRSYESSIGDILEYGKITENLEHIKDAIADNYRGPQRSVLTKFLSQRISDLKTHRDKVRAAREDSPGIAMLERGMKRYTTSIFALNIGLPAKQIGSAMSALGQGIIDNKYLLDSRSLSVLGKLTAGAYRDATISANVRADGSEDGLSGGILSQDDTFERPYLEELLGTKLTDPVEQQKQQYRFASVINRMLDNRNQYVGDIQFDDLGLNESTLTSAQKALQKYDQFAGDRLMAATRRADRAPVLYYYESAKLQAEAEGLSGDQYWDRVADLTERTVAETYNLDNILERTPNQLSTNFFLKVIGMYSSQQQKIGNLLIKSMIAYAKAEPGTVGALEARSKLLHTLGYGIIVNAVYVSAVSAATSVILALLSGDEPKDADELLIGAGYDSVRNVVGLFPGIGQLGAEYFISANDNIYGNESMVDVTALNNLKTGIDAIIAAGDYLTEEDAKKSDKALDSAVGKSFDFLSKNLGLPTTVTRVIRKQVGHIGDEKTTDN